MNSTQQYYRALQVGPHEQRAFSGRFLQPRALRPGNSAQATPPRQLRPGKRRCSFPRGSTKVRPPPAGATKVGARQEQWGEVAAAVGEFPAWAKHACQVAQVQI